MSLSLPFSRQRENGCRMLMRRFDPMYRLASLSSNAPLHRLISNRLHHKPGITSPSSRSA